MSLIGWPLMVLSTIVALIAPVLAVLLWKRAHIVARFAMVLACQVLAVTATGIALNNYGYFYGTWGELLGQQPQVQAEPLNTNSKVPLGTRISSEVSLVRPNAPKSNPSWAVSGRFVRVNITGASTGLHETALVYLPPQYYQKAYAHTNFPAVEEFTGYPAAPRMLHRLGQYANALKYQIVNGQAKPMILIASTPSPLFPRDTECTDIPGGPQVLSFFAQDVPQAMQSAFRVSPDRWGALGDSTGGYCATKLAMNYPTIFTTAVSMSGYYNAISDNTTGDLWGGSQPIENGNDLVWRLQHLPPPPITLLATMGSDETGREGVANMDAFLSQVKAPMRAYRWVIPGGAHNFVTWHSELPRVFNFLSTTLYAKAPTQQPINMGNGNPGNNNPGLPGSTSNTALRVHSWTSPSSSSGYQPRA